MSDQLLEDVFDFVNRQDGEQNRLSVARAAKLAAEYRAQQLKRQRMQKAIEKRAQERRELMASTRASGDDRAAGAGLSPLPPADATEGNEQ